MLYNHGLPVTPQAAVHINDFAVLGRKNSLAFRALKHDPFERNPLFEPAKTRSDVPVQRPPERQRFHRYGESTSSPMILPGNAAGQKNYEENMKKSEEILDNAAHISLFILCFKVPGTTSQKSMERVMGIEPTYEAWEASILPLNYTRKSLEARQFPEMFIALFDVRAF